MDIKEQIKQRREDIHLKTTQQLKQEADQRFLSRIGAVLLLGRGISTLKKRPLTGIFALLAGSALLYQSFMADDRIDLLNPNRLHHAGGH